MGLLPLRPLPVLSRKATTLLSTARSPSTPTYSQTLSAGVSFHSESRSVKSQGLARSRAPVSDHRLFDCAQAGIDAPVVIINEANTLLNAFIQVFGGLTLDDLEVLFTFGPKNFEDCPSLNGLPLGPVNLYKFDDDPGIDDCLKEKKNRHVSSSLSDNGGVMGPRPCD